MKELLEKQWKMILGALAFIGALGTTVSTVDEIRWWAWRSEIIEVGSVSYRTAINQKYDFQIILQNQINQCQKDTQCRAFSLNQLEAEKKRLEDEINSLKKQQERYSK